MLQKLVAVGAILTTGWVGARAEDNAARLYSVIRANDLTGLKMLLDQGIGPNTPDSRQITPLMVAAEIGSVDAMSLLIARGADVNAQNASGSTALMWSVTDARKIRLLLDHDADVNRAARSGRTALILAAYTNPSSEVVRLLLARGADAKAMDKRQETAVNAAAFGNDTAALRLLVAAGGDVNQAETFIGWTPLMNAAGNGNLEAVRFLLSKGAKVNAVSMREHLPQVKNGTVAFGGFTPLLTAAAFAPPELVKTLLDAGAEVNVADIRGFTPLMLAIGTDRQNPENVRLLLSHGADTHAQNLDDETALDWARKIGTSRTIEALGGSSKPLVRTISAADTPALRTAVERSVGLLEKTTAQFFQKSACFACHEQVAADIAATAAHAKGIAVDQKAAAERQRQTVGLNPSGPTSMEGPAPLGGADNALYAAEDLVRTGYAPNPQTDFLAANLAMQQAADGSWRLGGYSRSPMQDSNFSRTAMALRALKAYGTPGRDAEMKARIERAKQWLLHAEPVILEDCDMALLGVSTAGAGRAELQKLAEPILARQQPDGGWAQRDAFPSDAYATGMTLTALADAGILQPSQEAYRKGVRFLLSTQAVDGSWHVVSRATKFQPYFDSGFPYDHDQWISTMATAWSVNALALAIDAPAAVAGVR
ncbi:MAG: ankyrin repeat domain-containing protein [Acidobacteriia bacterium]|nr:ankyrin repeat domain-containing protein [Terriglobia bacterium]